VLRLASDESGRIGGLVYERLGRVPKVGDEVQLDDGVTITVLSVEGLRPRQLRITYPQPDEVEVSASEAEAVHHEGTT
jgi:magnesium and cobalt exporter, CNNM family